MLSEKEEALRKISAVDFAIHDIELFLDSHRENKKATELLKQYRKWREELVAEYEQKYGDFVTCVKDVKARTPWSWTNGPWPWEIEGENI